MLGEKMSSEDVMAVLLVVNGSWPQPWRGKKQFSRDSGKTRSGNKTVDFTGIGQ